MEMHHWKPFKKAIGEKKGGFDKKKERKKELSKQPEAVYSGSRKCQPHTNLSINKQYHKKYIY